ncbi:hypothetical protein Pan258_28980 [Symmachiella dynata]|uniref:DUF4175 family protein n=1 Tax=Symmachiella dynata TaxID=2527995 RepID=UPI00118CFF78|nr:DUF4175 family protein [Symmachiella dynata]QDT48852.1 hypothetical protein Pan258_28980 [Symmachiella dynata]
MFTPLETRLSELRQRVRRALFVNGVSWLITVFVGSIAVIGIADWLFRFSDSGVRLILSLTVVAATAYVAYRRLIAPLLVQLNDLDLALRIERLHPELKDSLASTVQFLNHDIDPALGSPELQQQVVNETSKHLQNVDFDEVVQTRNVKRIMLAATAVCLATAVLVGLNRADASIAFKRMVLPLSDTNWPKQTQLRVLGDDFESVHSPETPLRIAIGETLTIHIDNARGGLPDNGTIFFRFPDKQETSQQLSVQSITDREDQPRDVFVSSLLVLEGPIQFRVEAGDDLEMPWYTIEAVVPPNLEDLQITLTPPEYLGQPSVDLPAGTGHVEGLVGTTVTTKARADKPLVDAHLHVYEQSQPLVLGPEGLTFGAEFTIAQPGNSTYWLAFRDREGHDSGQSRHYDLRGIEDRVPEIEITDPTTNLRVTAVAKIPLRMVAKDDLGLKEIRLVYHTGSLSGIEDADDAEATEPQMVSVFNDSTRPQHQSATYEFDLSTMDLKPGDTITLHAEATDAFDLGEEHVGKSLPRIFTVVTSEEKRQELADRQADIMADLELAQKQQDAAHQQVRQLQIQLNEAGELRPQDVDTLQQTEMTQRRAAQKLSDAETGVRKRAQQLLNDIRDNAIDDPKTTRRMTKLDEELKRLGQENLPQIEEDLTAVRKREQNKVANDNAQTDSAPKSADATAEQQQALGRAEKNQQIVAESLNAALKEMAEWRTHRDLAGDLEQLVESQQKLNQEAEKLGKQTLTKLPSELTKQEQTDLQRLGERQRQAAKRLDQLKSKVEETLKSSADQDSTESQLLEEVAEQMQEQSTAANMREAARQLQKNDVGAAMQNQRELLKQLQDLQDTLHNRRQTDTAEMVKKLKQEEQKLAELKDRQKELMRKIEKAQDLQDPEERQQELKKLAKEQQQLREEAQKMTRRLRRLQIQKGRDATARAADRQQQAAEQLKKDDPIAAAEQAQEALDDMEQAQRELAQQRREAEEQLAQEQLEKIADELRAMIPRQQGVIDETARLQGRYAEQGKWSRGTLRSLIGLTEVQRGLQSETEKLRETLTAAEVFALALKGAARDMDRAALRLSERQADQTTQRHAMRAKQRFIDLVEALKPEKKAPQNKQNPQQQGPGPGGAQGGPPTDGIPQLAQLKVLKSMQSDLRERTIELAALIEAADEITPANQQALQDLALEQTELADLTRNLTKITAAAEEEPVEEEPAADESIIEDPATEEDVLELKQ